MRNIFAIRSMELSDMYNSREFDSFIGDKLGNDLFINDSERASRLHEYAENGSDGSMHCEVIEDWREFLGMLLHYRHDDCL